MSNIIAVRHKGIHKTYDLEVNHPDHQYYLSNGVLTSNSHSTLYSMISYHTAYLKAHYPLEFLVANLMSEVNSNAKISKENILRIKDEIRALGVKIVAPDINTSGMTYKIIDEKTLMTGLDSLKYMGKDSIPEILEKRPFVSFDDLLSRVDGRKVRSTTIQAMAASGCLDSFGLSRKQMFLHASDYKKKLQVYLKKSEEKRAPTFDYPWPEMDKKDWSIKDKYALEDFYLGEGISGTLEDWFEGFFDGKQMAFSDFPKKHSFIKLRSKQLRTDKEKEKFEKEQRKLNTYSMIDHDFPPVKGILTNVFSFKVKKEDSKIRGQVMARLVLQDKWGNDLSIIAFPQSWENIQNRIKERSAGKNKLEAGIALNIIGSFQYESEHVFSFIIDDILDHRSAPTLPSDLKARKVSMPRAKKKTKKELEALDKEALVEELEDEMIEDGFSPIDDDDDEKIDPFNN